MNLSSLSPFKKADRILVVDDSPDNVFLIQAILEEEGYKIATASDGLTALAKVEQSPPDLVLLDVMMPGMDGFEVTKRLRENTSLPFIPILLITAYDHLSVAKGLDTGADDFIRKPVEVDELLARVRSLLRLKHSIDERDQIAKQREDFVSRLTHDLRTPLIAADRMMGLMQQGALGELSPSMKEALDTMVRSNKNLLAMANTLLEVYRYEAGRKNLNFIPVDIRDLLQEVVKELSPLAVEKNLSLQLVRDKNPQDTAQIKTVVQGDRLELHRVFTNLIGNAIKFTDTGSVHVSLANTTGNANPDEPEVIVEVEDTGPGIPVEEQASLFERFRQGKHKHAGSGLGLHLSRRIVETHNGTIEIKSEVNKGSRFIVRLPLKRGSHS
ncbi:hybrid sensor histidine kinase/response regulator [Planktothrix sp. FACHB-1355]|uniref:histidine kinase n=1 Tax=Aerosakkonema funiforme FACHB-1375 TaxID=2949571 RepID=A0A926VB38_9CYAN|nr:MULTISPECIES: hybrid sensor histidine kinase/response regulator [Oscillatoriales]MBD2180415.1 hybrid sensor histidine kinase/response regulator [Aerosakkonema funiforme FACHB-1375]MBD3562919.1 hybrid sensor histidine kinase/response regulator [Planktothrix sp. FACHB-1355]